MKKPNLIHRNCFEIVERDLFLNHIKNLLYRGVTRKEFLEAYKNTSYLLRVEEVGLAFYKKYNMYVCKTDYFPVDDKLNLIDGPGKNSLHYYQDKDVMRIEHQTIKYLLRNNIIRLLEENSLVYSKVALIAFN